MATIGYTTVGTAGTFSQGISAGAICSLAGQYTASSGDQITGFTFYGSPTFVASSIATMAAYVTSSNVPGARLAPTVQITFSSTTPGPWTTSGLSQNLSAGVTYSVALSAHDGSSAINCYFDNGSVPGRIISSNASLTDPWPNLGSDSGRHYTWWATVTASSSSADASISITTDNSTASTAILAGTLASFGVTLGASVPAVTVHVLVGGSVTVALADVVADVSVLAGALLSASTTLDGVNAVLAATVASADTRSASIAVTLDQVVAALDVSPVAGGELAIVLADSTAQVDVLAAALGTIAVNLGDVTPLVRMHVPTATGQVSAWLVLNRRRRQ